jgi:hypothetical protein
MALKKLKKITSYYCIKQTENSDEMRLYKRKTNTLTTKQAVRQD